MGDFDSDLSPEVASLKPADSSDPQSDAPAYPVLTLAPEIVSEIFLNFIPAYPDFPPTFGLHSPLLLCAICRQWRAIAIATPELWRAIQISVSDGYTSYEAAAQLKLLKTWLSRSGSCPLSMDLSLPDTIEEIPRTAIDEEIVRTAVLHSERWEYANLSIPLGHMGLLRVANAMPLLRHLTFGFEDLIPSEPIILFDRAPRLKHVVLTPGFEKSFITLPWGQFTHLDAPFLDLGECAEILRDATNLVHCNFGICRTNDPILVLIPTIPIQPHLRHLDLRYSDEHYYPDPSFNLSGLFHNLTLPGLITLRVYEPGITLESLGEFISRSQCTLRELRVDISSRISESAYREALPSVKAIILEPQK
ncbi:hypothetical protein DFH08DRAFT_890078 [Mycena albidolilacea]|uniref:F-box domain-containing protein n=1 Tax=Mycena albidolilacea TaxID=1033008 RepID=A0AAD6ZF21_9AGAR|nr:hypothetical protein DFH08DRAFT_890078 [Mycena albidolilacea]